MKESLIKIGRILYILIFVFILPIILYVIIFENVIKEIFIRSTVCVAISLFFWKGIPFIAKLIIGVKANVDAVNSMPKCPRCNMILLNMGGGVKDRIFQCPKCKHIYEIK